MSRPEKYTESTRRRRLNERQAQTASDETAEDALLNGAPLLPFEETAGDHALLLQTNLGIGASYDLTRELAWLLVNTKQEYERQRRTAAVRPTAGEMNVLIADGAKLARRLREWSDRLPAALLHDTTVLIPGDPPLRAVIEDLARAFDLLSEQYPTRVGRPPGRRDTAQFVSAPLMLFAYRHAPETSPKQQRVFVRECLRLLQAGIECPDPDEHATAFDRWFNPVEKAAKRGLALSIARSCVRTLAQQQALEQNA